MTKEAEQLERALDTIRAEDTAKNEFIATLAHELRNPLAPVISGLELLRLDEKDPERIEILESAQRQSSIMRKLLDELLDVARVARHTYVLEREHVSLQSVLRQSVQGVEHFFKQRKLTFVSDMTEEKLMVDADPVRLAQVFMNILYNAGKYTHEEGTITLSVEKSGDTAVVKIKDTGIGIDEKMLARIFEPFVQDNRFAQVGTGLGIGLSIAKRLVEMHGGSISAQSAGKNRGSTFIVSLPLQLVTVAPKALAQSSMLDPTSILIVDDNSDAAESVARLLRTRGHATDLAFSGKDALTALSNKKHDVVLLDIGLPDMDGLVVANEIRTKEPQTTVIALSGYGSLQDKYRASSAGIHVHLTKPASLADIESAITESRENQSGHRHVASHVGEKLHKR